MNLRDIKLAIRRYYDEALSKGDYRIVDELFSKDVVIEGPGMPALESREAVKEDHRRSQHAFPDGCLSIDGMVAEGDRVVVWGRMYGTHQGEIMGIAPTGRSVRVPFVHIWRVEEDHVVHGLFVADTLDLLQQLGVTQLPQATAERVERDRMAA